MDSPKVRLDVWLWAARFFKTRSLAKQAIEAGHVRYDGERCKVSKEVKVGACLRVRQGWDEVEAVVQALSDQRRDATFARTLYEETPESRQKRADAALQRKAANVWSDERPSKKDRRLIHRFKRSLS